MGVVVCARIRHDSDWRRLAFLRVREDDRHECLRRRPTLVRVVDHDEVPLSVDVPAEVLELPTADLEVLQQDSDEGEDWRSAPHVDLRVGVRRGRKGVRRRQHLRLYSNVDAVQVLLDLAMARKRVEAQGPLEVAAYVSGFMLGGISFHLKPEVFGRRHVVCQYLLLLPSELL